MCLLAILLHNTHTYKSVTDLDIDLVDVTTLHPGEYTSVKPGEYHWFETKLNDAEVLEIYYLEPITEDIVRETVGGNA